MLISVLVPFEEGCELEVQWVSGKVTQMMIKVRGLLEGGEGNMAGAG